MYGSGLRLTEALQLPVKDVDFGNTQVVVRDGKGMKSRVMMLPASLIEPLQDHLRGVWQLHRQDLEKGYGQCICRLH